MNKNGGKREVPSFVSVAHLSCCRPMIRSFVGPRLAKQREAGGWARQGSLLRRIGRKGSFMAESSTHIFRVSLGPKLYREIEIESSNKLYDLAFSIIEAFDFDFDHPFGFYSKVKGFVLDSPVKYELFVDMGQESDAGSVKRTRIAGAFLKVHAKMTFLFDYGDDWQFLVELIRIGKTERSINYPRVVKVVGKAPKQYPDLDDDEGEDEAA